MKKARTVLSFNEAGLKPRDLMLGIQISGTSRAFPVDAVLKQKLILDRVGGTPVLLVVGPDGESIRAFVRRLSGVSEPPDFYRIAEDKPPGKIDLSTANEPLLMDEATGSRRNFQ
jgi:hypothetical protein